MTFKSLPFTIYPNKTKMALMLIGCLILMAGGILMIQDEKVMGWIGTIFFGLCAAVFLFQICYPKSSFLTISEDGLEIGSLFRSQKLSWVDISEFGTYSILQNGLPVRKMVGYNFSEHYQGASKARAFAKSLAGFEGALPDTYGYSAEELAQILSELHAEWIKKKRIDTVAAVELYSIPAIPKNIR